MLPPSFLYPVEACLFELKYNSSITTNHLRVHSERPKVINGFTQFHGAVHAAGAWHVIKMQTDLKNNYLLFECVDSQHPFHNAMAFPISPQMTRADIEGATHIFANSNNTGWQFLHSASSEHHDRELQVEAIITGMFDDVIRKRVIKTLFLVANEASTSRQRGEAGNADALNSFKNAVLSNVRAVERELHIGQHRQDNSKGLRQQALAALNKTIREWQLDDTKSYESVQTYVTPIKTRLETTYGYKPRWVLAAEKKAAADAAAETPS